MAKDNLTGFFKKRYRSDSILGKRLPLHFFMDPLICDIGHTIRFHRRFSLGVNAFCPENSNDTNAYSFNWLLHFCRAKILGQNLPVI